MKPPLQRTHKTRHDDSYNNNNNQNTTTASSSQIMQAIGLRLSSYPTSRWIFLVLCSPIVCATLPLLLAAELLVNTCQRRREYANTPLLESSRGGDEEEEEVERLRRCEEGFGGWFYEGEKEEFGLVLLERYLGDQLGLVGSVVCDYYGGLDSSDHGDCGGHQDLAYH